MKSVSNLKSISLLLFSVLGMGAAQAAPGLRETPRLTQGLYENSTELPTLAFIDRAQATIDIEIYTMTNPQFRARLRQALSRGIKVRVIKDATPVNEKCKVLEAPAPTDDDDCLDQKKLPGEIRKAGGSFVAFNKEALCAIPEKPCFQHGKMILIDRGSKPNQAVLLSTGNFNSSNFCDLQTDPPTCNRDYSFISADPEIIWALTQIFERDLLGAPYDVRGYLTPSVRMKITVSPYSEAPLLAFIKSAKESIVLQNQYLRQPVINQALISAAKAGVKVQIMVASFCAYGRPDAYATERETRTFRAFDAAGVQSRIFSGNMQVQGRPGYLHAKAVIVDGKYGWVGSVNGSTTATSSSREFGIFFNSSTAVRHLNAIMRSDYTHPQSESWQESLDCTKDPLLNLPPR